MIEKDFNQTLEEQIAEFKKNGGEVKHVEPGVSGSKPKRGWKEQSQKASAAERRYQRAEREAKKLYNKSKPHRTTTIDCARIKKVNKDI